MRNTGQIVIGGIIILIGLIVLIGAVFHVDPGTICWPIALISLGVWLLVRPSLISRDTAFRAALFGPVRRDGVWQVTDQEIWLFVGDVRLDLTQAEIAEREACIRLFAFVGDVRLIVPEGVGIRVSSVALVSTTRLLGEKRERIFSYADVSTPGYETAARKLHLETWCFVSDVKVVPA